MPGKRKSIRLTGYDYRQQGLYYVTICLNRRQCLFGEVSDGKMVLNDIGKIAEFTWQNLPNHNQNIELDEYIIMPNHIHGIIIIVGAGSQPALKHKKAGLEPAPTEHGLSEIIRQFKTFSAKCINQINNNPGLRLWQRNYYDHIIRNDKSLNKIRQYIINNPATWEKDIENPNAST